MKADVLEVDGLRLGGISGIFGNPNKKPWRHDFTEFEESFRAIIEERPDILLLHEGPDFPPERLRGSDFIRNLVVDLPADARPKLIVNGHCHWSKPMVELTTSGPAVLNVDARVVVLQRPV